MPFLGAAGSPSITMPRSVGEFGHSSKFQRVSRLGFVSAPTSLTGGQPNFAQTCRLLGWYTKLIYAFLGPLPSDGILPGAYTPCPEKR